ncbi:hypothetical protein FKM82_011396 [Ascaphus truei]
MESHYGPASFHIADLQRISELIVSRYITVYCSSIIALQSITSSSLVLRDSFALQKTFASKTCHVLVALKAVSAGIYVSDTRIQSEPDLIEQ